MSNLSNLSDTLIKEEYNKLKSNLGDLNVEYQELCEDYRIGKLTMTRDEKHEIESEMEKLRNEILDGATTLKQYVSEMINRKLPLDCQKESKSNLRKVESF